MGSSNSKNQKKKYKAIILDVDGTLIPNKRDGMPSEAVRGAIAKASKLIHIGVATSRPYFMLSHIVDHLNLSGPSIIAGGTQVIDITSKKILFEKAFQVRDAIRIGKLANSLSIRLIVLDSDEHIIFSNKYMPKKPLHLWIHALTATQADKFTKKLSDVSTVAVHKLPSWTKNRFDLSISHASATKQHAILEIAKILNIDTHEIIGVGDGYNDFPLLMACGLKVAMGNAVEDLKAIADYIAPPVEEDGVADVIEKFVL